MSTKVTFNVVDEHMDYARSPWDSAEYVLSEVNDLLKARGIDIEFDLHNCHEEDEWLEEYWNEKLPNYNNGVVIVETPKEDDCSFMDDMIK
jgi:hypothetical protein